MRHFLAIDRSLPTRLVIYFGEDCQLFLIRFTLIGQTVRTVFFQHDRCGWIFLRHKSFQIFLETLINHSGSQRIDRIQGFYLGIRIVHHIQLVHKPGIPECIRILQRLLFRVIDDIAGIQHIQGRTSSQRRHHVFSRLCLLQSTDNPTQLIVQPMVDQLLVTA